MLGFSPPEWMETDRWRSQGHPADYPIVKEYYEQMYLNADRYALEYRVLSRNGQTVWVKDQGIINEHASSGRFIMGVLSNITLEREDKEPLIQLALHDPLTGLANRNLLVERLDHVIKRARRNTESKFALLYLDLDNFKEVNDPYGHASGDQVFLETGERIRTEIEKPFSVQGNPVSIGASIEYFESLSHHPFRRILGCLLRRRRREV